MSYKGDTFGKKLARLQTWSVVASNMGADEFRSSSFAYLASHAGGDASVLLSLGVHPSRHLAIDYSAEELAAFSDRFESIRTAHGKASQVLSKPSNAGKFGCVFLDFTGNLCPDTVYECLESLIALKVPEPGKPSWFLVEIESAREGNGSYGQRQWMRAKAKASRSSALLRASAVRCDSGSDVDMDERVLAVDEALQPTFRAMGMVARPQLRVKYQSQKNGERGMSPMLIVGFEVRKLMEGKRTDLVKSVYRQVCADQFLNAWEKVAQATNNKVADGLLNCSPAQRASLRHAVDSGSCKLVVNPEVRSQNQALVKATVARLQKMRAMDNE